MNSAGLTQRYGFEPFRFDAATGELRGPDGSVKLRLQASMALELLLSRKGEIVSRRELREVLWPDERVVLFEASITAVIRELRRALGDDSKAPRFIETVTKRGYRFLTPSTEAAPASAGTVAPEPGLRKIHRRVGFLRIPTVLALMVLAASDSAHFQFPSHEGLQSPPVTVSVLAFEELSGVSALEVLTAALPRELIGWLGAVAPERLRVVDGTGMQGAGGMQDDPPDFTILGNVRRDHGAAVISATMLSGGVGRFAWGEDYRRSTDDPGLTAREVAARIAESVLAKSLPRWSNGSATATANVEAAGAFRRGTKALAELSLERTVEAVEAFREATELDPAFSAAYAHLAEALVSWTGPAVTRDRVEQARQAALVSVALAPTNAVGHRVLGEIGLYYDRNWQAAGDYLERSVALSPSDASGHHSYAAWLSARGRHDEALREIDLAAALEPASVAISIDVMFLRYYARDFEGTVSAGRRLEKLWPESQAPRRYILLSKLATGDVVAAAAEARARLAGPEPTPASKRSASALSDSDALEAYWTTFLDAATRYIGENSGDPTVLAMPNVQLGRFDAATSALEAALTERHFSYFLPYLGVSPEFDLLCGHPEFEAMLRRLRQSALGAEPNIPRCAAAITSGGGLGTSSLTKKQLTRYSIIW